MSKLISGFTKILPQLQAREIEKELSSPENQIRLGGNIDAIRAELQLQLRRMLESDTNLRFNQILLSEDDYRDSETINWMVDKIAGDLTSLFSETDQLLKIQDFNEKFFREEIIGKAEQALDILDNELSRLELLSGRFSGLTDGVAENFKVDGQRLSSQDPFAHFAFIDPKGNNSLVPEQEMPINLAIGGLTLPPDVRSIIRPSRIRDVQTGDTLEEGDPFALAGATNPSTPGQVTQVGRISNLTDGREDTIWRKSVRTKIQSGGAKLNVMLEFTPGPVKLNYLQITPGVDSAHTLIGVNYVSADNTVSELFLPNGEIRFTGKVLLPFPISAVKKISLVFAQEDFRVVPGVAPDVVEYSFSFAEIQLGLNEFKPLGYYVAKTLTLPLISQIYLSATVNGHLLSFDEDEDLMVPTIEFWAAYRDIDEGENVLFSTYIPLLPVEKDFSYEKLILNERDQARLMFKVKEDILDEDEDTLHLTRDGISIVRPVDYNIEQSENDHAESTILNIQNGFNVQREYYARYTPLHLDLANRPIPFLDRTGLIEYLPDGTVKISRSENSRAVRSEVNLIVLMRGTEDRKRTLALDRLIFGVG